MSIIHINTSDTSGGAAIAALRLVNALNQSGVESKLLVKEKNSEDKFTIGLNSSHYQKFIGFSRFALERLFFSFYEKSKNERFAFSPANIGQRLDNHVLIKNADIINLHWINFGYLSLHGLKKLSELKKPIVWTMHDMWPFTGGCHHSFECENFTKQCGNCHYLKKQNSNDLSHKVFLQKQEIFRSMDLHPVAVGSWLAGRAQNSTLFNKFKINIIPNVIDNHVFAPGDKQLLRKKLQLPENKKLILFGSMKINDPVKGWPYFSDAINKLIIKYPGLKNDMEILLIGNIKGDSSFLTQIPLKINQLGVINSMPRLAEAYSAADVTAVPSLYETFSLVAAESIACGTPVVAFNNSGPVDIIDHLSTGYLATFKSSDDFAKGLEWALESSLVTDYLHNTIKNRFSGEVVAHKYKILYEALNL